jgi:exonuclease SbcD
MRILHTSDWHLGKRLYKLDRSLEHEKFFDWLIKTLNEEKIDVLLMAGDVFDTPTPPHHALEMFYNFLHRLSQESEVQSYFIAGNHDSGLLIEAPSKILRPHRVKVWGKLSQDPEDHWIDIKVKEETLHLCAIPFFRSHELLPQGEGDALLALSRYIHKETQHPKLLMLHHLAGMYEAAGSEQAIALSGVDSIPNQLIEDFDYVALGHIHKPQRIGSKSYYSGSPIPLRFSETIAKSVVIIESTGKDLKIETLPIPNMRALLSVKATEENLKEKIAKLESSSPLTPMVEIQLTLNSPRMGLIDEIKALLEKKNMELLSYQPTYVGEEKRESRGSQLFELSTTDLFKEFYATKYPQEPEIPEDLMHDFSILLERVKNAPHSS